MGNRCSCFSGAFACDSPHPLPKQLEPDTWFEKLQARSSMNTNYSPTPTAAPSPEPKIPRQDSSNDRESYEITLEDPTSKVLPAALNKYRITNANWEDYAIFICYGSSRGRIERCLSLDEKPLLRFHKLKDAGKNPVFMLKHIKDIPSPIVIARQKHAARKASSINDRPNTTIAAAANNNLSSHIPNGLNSATQASGGWLGTPNTTNIATFNASTSPSHNPISHAVAIYPYMAEQADEFDVAVGDMFIVLSRAQRWWVVQRDPEGTGMLSDAGIQGWVPAGCLLETMKPVAVAIQEAQTRSGACSSDEEERPILPPSIISTSFPGIILMDYKKMADGEMDVVKDGAVKVYKEYNHWSYVVQEDSGKRGWVPSWFIGRVAKTADNSTNDTNQVQASTPGHTPTYSLFLGTVWDSVGHIISRTRPGPY
ncbi:protein kinase regulator [Moniliophthora roreri MCA 2997]|uniref:Protein kinase regulator n=2 Tax=Moniliophthora roreri TaxID=221103 RepID=V2XXV3_MONRO|nr:protein kinase regulator [Moniliophthora roreri MCA 2997]KAI3600490.1 protein kinase regulator [Moniliophthora roreri]